MSSAQEQRWRAAVSSAAHSSGGLMGALVESSSSVVPSRSCVIERCSNHSCQKGSRCPFTRMTYLIHLCSVRMTFHRLGRRIPSEQVEHSRQKDTKRILLRRERSSQKRVAKRLPYLGQGWCDPGHAAPLERCTKGLIYAKLSV